LSSVQGVLRGAFSVLSVVVAVDLLGASRASAGYLQAAAGLGGVVAGLLLARRFERGGLAVAFTIGVVLRTAPFALIAMVPSLGAAVIFMAINGVGNTAMTTGGLSLLQRLMPNHVTGRALSAVGMVTTLGVAAGAAIVAPLLTITNARTLLIIIGVAWPVAALSGWSLARQGDGRATAYDADIAVLGSVPFLARLPLVALETAARNLHRSAVATGEKVIVQGTHGDRFYVLVSGIAAAEIDGQVVNTITEGGWFGELALLHDTHRAATVRMLADGEVAYLKRSDFLEALAVDASAIDLATTGWERESTTAIDVPADLSIAELLAQIPLMAHATRRDVEALAANGKELKLDPSEVIYEEGDDPDAFYLVLSGNVEVVTGGSVVADIGRGGWFGELALLHNETRRASVRTQTHASLLRIDADSFKRVADTDEAP
jgi:CRP-like cAMP-binding protein